MDFEGRETIVDVEANDSATYTLEGIKTTAATAESGLITVSDANGGNAFSQQQVNITSTQTTTPEGTIPINFSLNNQTGTITISNFKAAEALGAEAVVSCQVESYPPGSSTVALNKAETYNLPVGTKIVLGAKPSKLWFSTSESDKTPIDSFTLTEAGKNLYLHLPTYK